MIKDYPRVLALSMATRVIIVKHRFTGRPMTRIAQVMDRS